jgi:hypothetical protein
MKNFFKIQIENKNMLEGVKKAMRNLKNTRQLELVEYI